jgi:hypothetical protein
MEYLISREKREGTALFQEFLNLEDNHKWKKLWEQYDIFNRKFRNEMCTYCHRNIDKMDCKDSSYMACILYNFDTDDKSKFSMSDRIRYYKKAIELNNEHMMCYVGCMLYEGRSTLRHKHHVDELEDEIDKFFKENYEKYFYMAIKNGNYDPIRFLNKHTLFMSGSEKELLHIYMRIFNYSEDGIEHKDDEINMYTDFSTAIYYFMKVINKNEVSVKESIYNLIWIYSIQKDYESMIYLVKHILRNVERRNFGKKSENKFIHEINELPDEIKIKYYYEFKNDVYMCEYAKRINISASILDELDEIKRKLNELTTKI